MDAPRRAAELAGGSAYFIVKGSTLFRMPFLGLEPVRDGFPDVPECYRDHTAIVCAPHIVMVEARTIRFLRGWRYLDGADVPPDLDVPARPQRPRGRTATAYHGPRTTQPRPRLSAPTSPSRPASTSPHRTHRLDAYRLDLIRPLQATHSPPPRAPLQTRTKLPA